MGPTAVGTDSKGLIVEDDFTFRIRRVVNGIISTAAGNQTAGDTGDGGPATQAIIASVDEVAVGPNGNLYIVDNSGFRIRMVDSAGIITTIAGNGTSGYTGDRAPASQAELSFPHGIAFDQSGALFSVTAATSDGLRQMASSPRSAVGSHVARVATAAPPPRLSSGISTMSPPIRQATSLAEKDPLFNPSLDRVRRIDTHGVVTTVAGSGSGGDPAKATKASIEATAIGIDDQGDLLIASQNQGGRTRSVPTGFSKPSPAAERASTGGLR